MMLIPCTDDCLYQKEGLCTLDHCALPGRPMHGHSCVHYVSVSSVPEDEVPGRYSQPEAASDVGSS